MAMRKIFQQIIYDLRTQPVIGIVSVIGTALAILLVMMSTIVYEIDYAPMAPESNRDRLLYDPAFYIGNDESSICSSLSLHAIRKLYGGMKTPQVVAAVSRYFEPVDVASDNGKPVIVDLRRSDAEMWKVFDHTFLTGSPYTAADVAEGADVAVIDESTARNLFSSTDVVGRTVMVRGKAHRIRGVIRDVSPLMRLSYAQIWLPAVNDAGRFRDNRHTEMFGGYAAVFMGETPASLPAIREEARGINEDYNREIRHTGYQRIDCEAPHTQLAFSQVAGANNPPDMTSYYITRGLLMAIFLLVPAINLSSMTQSRLRRRCHEIGVRRAFGATRRGILLSILRENLVVTLAGGIIGLILSLAGVWLFADTLFEVDTWQGVSSALRVTGEMLFRWSTFGWALLFCLILNLLSAGIPAWRASRLNPVEAINQVED